MAIPLKFLRKNFNNFEDMVEINNLLDVQKESYYYFLQRTTSKKRRGLHRVFSEIFPIEASILPKNKQVKVVYRDYFIGTTRSSIQQAKEQGTTLSVPIIIKLDLMVSESKKIDSELKIVNSKEIEYENYIKESEFLFYIGNVPLMTNKGTFIINGIEKVLISQLLRSPGIYYTKNENSFQDSLQLIPSHGSWITVQIDKQNNIFICLNKRIYIPLALFLLAMDFTKEEIIKFYYTYVEYIRNSNEFELNFDLNLYKNRKVSYDIHDSVTKECIISKGTLLSKDVIEKLKKINFQTKPLSRELIETYLSKNYILIGVPGNNKDSLFFITEPISPNKQYSNNLKKLIVIDPKTLENSWKYNLLKEIVHFDNISSDRARLLVYKLIEPTNTTIGSKEKIFFNDTFFNKKYYDLSKIGRQIFNNKFDFQNEDTSLTKKDLLYFIKHYFNIKEGLVSNENTNINQLPNRRIQSTGHLLENIYHNSLSIIKTNIIQKLSHTNIKSLKNREKILNIFDFNLLKMNIQYFFNTSSLSQFIDQVNVLSELTNKRRITLLGTDGLSQESTTLDNRDTYSSYYGRLCPIETPEGHNVGLVNTFSIYSKVTDNGLILTPYQTLKNNQLSTRVSYLSSESESSKHIMQFNENVEHLGTLVNKYIYNRHDLTYKISKDISINLKDISSKQILSVSSSLIPFLEHNDASRALMGANMQRQAVPLIRNQFPLVGTGTEGVMTKKSKYNLYSENVGKVAYVDNTHILISDFNNHQWRDSIMDSFSSSIPYNVHHLINRHLHLYKLTKFNRSNQNTLINYSPNVVFNECIGSKDIIAEGITSKQGDLSLGNNLLAAYMSFGGQSFEDSMVISEEVVKKDLLSSVHKEVFDVLETRNQEEIEIFTDKLPNNVHKPIENLNIDGIIRLGTKVKQGDILVGRIKIKIENDRLKKEEFQNINELISNLKDNLKLNHNILETSFKVPKGKDGFVTKVTKFYKTNNLNTSVNRINNEKVLDYSKVCNVILYHFIYKNLLALSRSNMFRQKKLEKLLVTSESFTWWDLLKLLRDKSNQTQFCLFKILEKIDFNNKHIFPDSIKNNQITFKTLLKNASDKLKKPKVANVHNIPLKMVRIEITYKHQIKPGDKITGRYGNKGIISQVLPVEDMPYFTDGTPIDVILNPISISSRMNFGQILETHLAWASVNIGKQIELLYKTNKEDERYQDIKTILCSVYRSSHEEFMLRELKQDEFNNRINTFCEGIPLKISNFNSPNQKEINKFLKFAKIKSNGQTFLREGRTGELFNRKVTVGYIYTLKLNHFVDNKIHARSIGPYNLISKQPLIGKAHSGGQRFGEMEVWALQGYGAAYTLQELLTVKSDSYSAKEALLHLVYENQEDLTKIIPQSFHLLVRELWSLGLFVDLY